VTDKGPFRHQADCPAEPRGDLGSDCTCGTSARARVAGYRVRLGDEIVTVHPADVELIILSDEAERVPPPVASGISSPARPSLQIATVTEGCSCGAWLRLDYARAVASERRQILEAFEAWRAEHVHRPGEPSPTVTIENS
jgi:hypothetical protein